MIRFGNSEKVPSETRFVKFKPSSASPKVSVFSNSADCIRHLPMLYYCEKQEIPR